MDFISLGCMSPATGMQEEQNVGNGAAQRGPSGRLPAVRAKIARRLVENYGVAIAGVARQMGISTSGLSKILPRTWSS